MVSSDCLGQEQLCVAVQGWYPELQPHVLAAR